MCACLRGCFLSLLSDLYRTLTSKEFETGRHVAKLLKSYNDGAIVVTEGVATTGVIGYVYGTGPKSSAYERYCIMFRADMDGLPVQEIPTKFNADYRSRNAGVMHACGHDGHMTMLLAAAKLLSSPEGRATYPSNMCIKFCFQPAEEDQGGAPVMISEGVLEDDFEHGGKVQRRTGPRVDEVYGIHLWSYMPYGQIGMRPGPMMAATDQFYITIKGVGGHGAVPQGTRDAIICGAHLVTQLQTIISRNVAPLDAGVVTVGTFNAGTTTNVIADRADISGTVRSLRSSVQELIQTRISEICQGVGQTYGCEVSLKYVYGYPATVNHSEAVRIVERAAKKVVGRSNPDAVVVDMTPTMGAEDFSFFLNSRPVS